ncbi:hypothetical protein LguiB_033863 [Lonicera macranthoides]
MNETIKSSTEKKHTNNSFQKDETTPMPKSTLSTRNLFTGRDILNQITDFCNELNRLAMRTKQGENREREGAKKNHVHVNKYEVGEFSGCDLRGLDEREKENKPLEEAPRQHAMSNDVTPFQTVVDGRAEMENERDWLWRWKGERPTVEIKNDRRPAVKVEMESERMTGDGKLSLINLIMVLNLESGGGRCL